MGFCAWPMIALEKSETYSAPSNPKFMSTGRKAGFFEDTTSSRTLPRTVPPL
jgi:hypothetical protein